MNINNENNQIENQLDIFKEIFEISKLTNNYYEKIYKKFNITQVQFEVLYLLYISPNKSMKMSLLCNELKIAKSGITILVDKMTLAGLVIRRFDEEDRRIINVIPTEKGIEIIKTVLKSNDIFKVSIFDFMKEEEKELLCNLIIKIKRTLE